MVLDPEFGSWLAGLTDGEGSFFSHVTTGYCNLRFAIKLRSDDAAVLQYAKDCTGLGHLGYDPRRDTDTRNRHPQVHWRVTRRYEQIALVGIFDRFPLRSKKAKDFAIWREMVLLRERLNVGQARVKDYPAYWSRLVQLHTDLRASRAFSNGEDQLLFAAEATLPVSQLTFVT